MLSPVKVITASAVAFAIGGMLLISKPFDQAGMAPGAATEVFTPEAFTASYVWSHQPTIGTVEVLPNGIERTNGAAWLFRSSSASDPRFEGVSTLSSTWDSYPEAGVSLVAHVVRYVNEEGAWQSAPYARFAWHSGDTPNDAEMVSGESWQYTLHGEGMYEGLTALVLETWNGGGWDLEGYIFEGELPPAPAAWTEATESP